MPNPLFDRLFAPHAGSTAPFLHLADGSTISYRTFLARAAQFANVLAERGVVAGDRVAAQIPKSPDALALFAATAQAGAVFLPLNPAYTVGEVSYFVENSRAKVLVCDPADAEVLTRVADTVGATLLTLNDSGGGTLADEAHRAPESFATIGRAADDLAALLYTSGTTGRSKGAMLTQTNLISNAQVLAEAWRFTADDVLLHALPIFHTHGLFVATNVTLVAGGAMIFLPKFDPDAVLAALPSATVMMGVPTFYTRLLGDPRFARDAAQHMRLFVSGSAPLLEETHRQFEAQTGHRILERYGMTETNMNTSNPYDGPRRAGTVGPPLPGVEVKVTDPDTGAPLPQGDVGQIEVRGPNVFAGYWEMPEKTAAELRENGFFLTGDLGRFDADGYIQIVGRSKDLIISGGYNIYPKEIELVLDAQPGVLESAVIGVPHPDFGESPVAVIVAEPGQAPSEAVLSGACSRALARFKQPRVFVFVEALPRNAMGKVQKNALRATHAGLFALGQATK
ncbi:MAG: malonyl-CoA synthase [Pseudomonadota bacterium]